MTPEVALFLRNLLGGQQVQIGQPDFEQVVAVASQALAELDQIIDEGAVER